MNKREHFERWLKSVKPNMPLDYNESEGYYYHDIVSMMWQAWQASPKTRPTEPNKISKEQLSAMKADTTDIVDNLRGIYPGIADAYPVNPLMLKAADEIERLRKAAKEAYQLLAGMRMNGHVTPGTLPRVERVQENLRNALGGGSC